MKLILHVTATCLIISAVDPLRPLNNHSRRSLSLPGDTNTRLIFRLLDHISSGRRNRAGKDMAKELLRRLKKAKHLREDDDDVVLGEDEAKVAETELKSTLTQQKAAVYDRPFVEQSGKNDYLVMHTDNVNPYKTVIPNAIYYNIEKKCVNWLDDCSLKGIRAKLLRGVKSPFK